MDRRSAGASHVARVFKNYVNFKERAALSEFWWFLLFFLLVLAGFAWIEWMLFGTDTGWVAALAYLAMLLPYLGVTVRRLHDTGKSGWLILVSVVPLVGPILLIVWLATRSEPRPNRWGPPPQ